MQCNWVSVFLVALYSKLETWTSSRCRTPDISSVCTALHPLVLASKNGNVDAVRFLLAEFSETIVVDFADGENNFSVSMAADKGHLEIVKLLVSEGTDVDGIDFYLASLFIAAGGGRMDVVRFLCEQGATINSPPDTLSPIHMAAFEGHTDVVAYLIEEWGASTSHFSKRGLTLLDEAVKHPDLVRVLLSYGCDSISSPSALCHVARRGAAASRLSSCSLSTVRTSTPFGQVVNQVATGNGTTSSLR